MLNNQGRYARQVAVSVVPLVALTVIVILTAALIGFCLYDYQDLRRSLPARKLLAQTIENQLETLGQQRLQIQSFALEINTLKDKLVELDRFEAHLRVIANLGPDQADHPLFGVGGTAPEDIDPQLELTQRHEELMREMHRQVGALETAALGKADSLDNLLDELEAQRSLLASTPAIRPTIGWMTSTFGYRESPFTGRKEFHKGMDIAHREGTPILAAADGIVSFAGKKGSMGKVVVIDHGHGMITRYAHLSEVLKQRGEKIKRGDIIARMGNSGRSTGPHLHYEVHLNGVPVNPANYILN